MVDKIAEAKAKGIAQLLAAFSKDPKGAALFNEKTGSAMTPDKAAKIADAVILGAMPTVVPSVLPSFEIPSFGKRPPKPQAEHNPEKEEKEKQDAYDKLVGDIYNALTSKEGQLGLNDDGLRRTIAEQAAVPIIQDIKSDSGWQPKPKNMPATRAIASEVISSELMKTISENKMIADSLETKTGSAFTSDKAKVIGQVAFDIGFDGKLMKDVKAGGGGKESYNLLVKEVVKGLEAREDTLQLKDANVRLAVAENLSAELMRQKSDPGFTPSVEMMPGTRAIVSEVAGDKLMAEANAAGIKPIIAFFEKKTGSTLTPEKAKVLGEAGFDILFNADLMDRVKAAGGGQQSYDMLVKEVVKGLEARENTLGLKDTNVRLAIAENASAEVMRQRINPNFVPSVAMMPGTKAMVKELGSQLLNEQLDQNAQMIEMAEKANGQPIDRNVLCEAISESTATLIADPRFRKQSPQVQRVQLRDAVAKGIRLIANDKVSALLSDEAAFNIVKQLNKNADLPPVDRNLYIGVLPAVIPAIVDEKITELDNKPGLGLGTVLVAVAPPLALIADKERLKMTLLKAAVDIKDLKEPLTEAMTKVLNDDTFFDRDDDSKKRYLAGLINDTIESRSKSDRNKLLRPEIGPNVADIIVPNLSQLPEVIRGNPAKQAEQIYSMLVDPIKNRDRFIKELTALAALKDDERQTYIEEKQKQDQQEYASWDLYRKGLLLDPTIRMILKVEDIPPLAAKYHVDLRAFGMAPGSDAKECIKLAADMKNVDASSVVELIRRKRDDGLWYESHVATGLTELRGSTPRDLEAVAEDLHAMGIFFKRVNKNGEDRIIVDEAIVRSFGADVPSKDKMMTSKVLIARQNEEKARPMKEEFKRVDNEIMEQEKITQDLDKRCKKLYDYLIQCRGARASGGPPPVFPYKFDDSDCVRMQWHPEYQTEEFKKTYALFQVIADQDKKNFPGAAGAILPLPPGTMELFSSIPKDNHEQIMKFYEVPAKQALISLGSQHSPQGPFPVSGQAGSAPVGAGGIPFLPPTPTPMGAPGGNGVGRSYP